MSKRSYVFGLAMTLLYLGAASAQYPVLDRVADKIIMKYQTATCEQLYQERAQKKQPGPGEEKAIQMLRGDPQMRAAFIGKIAPPIANKMFECGMIP